MGMSQRLWVFGYPRCCTKADIYSPGAASHTQIFLPLGTLSVLNCSGYSEAFSRMSDSDAFWKGGCPRGCEFLSTPKAGSRLISIALGAAGHAQIFLPLGCCLSPKLSGNKEAVKDLSFRLPSCGTKADISCTRSSRLHSDNPSFADVVCLESRKTPVRQPSLSL